MWCCTSDNSFLMTELALNILKAGILQQLSTTDPCCETAAGRCQWHNLQGNMKELAALWAIDVKGQSTDNNICLRWSPCVYQDTPVSVEGQDTFMLNLQELKVWWVNSCGKGISFHARLQCTSITGFDKNKSHLQKWKLPLDILSLRQPYLPLPRRLCFWQRLCNWLNEFWSI